MSCSVVELNDLDSLASYRLAWDALLAQSANSNYFQTLDWLDVYWRHQPRENALRVLVVQSFGKTIGFLPLVERTEHSRVGPIRVLGYPLDAWGSFYGPIGPNVTATLLAGLGHVARTERTWEALDFRWIDEANDRGRTWRALEIKGLHAYVNPTSQTALVDLAAHGTWEAYWASRTSKWRTNVRRNEKRLAEMGAVEHVRYRPLGAACDDGDPRWDLYEQCETVASRSWQGDSTSGTTITHPSIREFVREQHAAAARAGGVDLNLLLVGGQAVAFNYCYHYRGQLFGLRMGYDRSSGAEGAGSVLLKRMIEESFLRGDRLFDMGAEYLECKSPWLTRTATISGYRHFGGGISRAQLLHAQRWAQTLFGK